MIKTPMSALNEFCITNSMVALYDLPERELCKEYTCKVTFSDPLLHELKAVGKGKSKRESKHSAAYEALKMIFSNGSLKAMYKCGFDLKNISSPYDEIAENHMRKLKSICVCNLLPLPEFDTIGVMGMPVMYTMQCRISTLTTTADAHSKKAAKQYAAASMINKLFDMVNLKLTTETDNDNKAVKNNNLPIVGADTTENLMKTFTIVKNFMLDPHSFSRINLSDYHDICTKEQWYCPLNYAVNQKFKNLDDIDKIDDPVAFIRDICVLSDHEFSFSPINRIVNKNYKEKYVVLKLITPPPWVVFGKGVNYLQAEINASRKMIMFLRVLAR